MADMLGVVLLEEDHSLSFNLQCTRKDLGEEEWNKLVSWWSEGRHTVRDSAKLALGRITIRFDTAVPLIEVYNGEYVDATRNRT